jgi:hypothetical protein
MSAHAPANHGVAVTLKASQVFHHTGASEEPMIRPPYDHSRRFQKRRGGKVGYNVETLGKRTYGSDDMVVSFELLLTCVVLAGHDDGAERLLVAVQGGLAGMVGRPRTRAGDPFPVP